MHEATLRIILEKGIADKEIREDISVEETIYIIIGSMRYLVTRWRLDGHRFDLYAAGQRVLGTLKELLRC